MAERATPLEREQAYRTLGLDPNWFRCRTCGGLLLPVLEQRNAFDRELVTAACEHCNDPDPLNRYRGY